MATTKATTLAHTLGGISSDISTAEINRLDGVTGDLQTQLDAKAPKASPTFTGTITAPNDSISGDAVSGGTIGAGTFNGTVGSSSTFNDGINSANIGQFTAKAWVYWDGYSSPANRNSFNCTLTRSATGEFYITFTNNMSNTYFVVCAQGQVATAYPQTVSVTNSSKAVSRSGVIYFNENGTAKDPWTGQIVVFGD